MLGAAQEAWALGTETRGNEPLSPRNYEAWKGIVPIVNDKTRVYEQWVNGNEHFYYKGGTKELNAALAHFAKVEVTNHVVVLRPGPGAAQTFDRTTIPCNWSLHVIGGLARTRANDDIEDLEWQKDPVLTIYIGVDIDLAKLEFPKGVTLRGAPGSDPKDEKQAVTQKKITEFVEAHKRAAKK
jgi:hypothetical protein